MAAALVPQRESDSTDSEREEDIEFQSVHGDHVPEPRQWKQHFNKEDLTAARARRSTAKRLFTNTCKAVFDLIRTNAGPSAIMALRESANDHFMECKRLHQIYCDAPSYQPTKTDQGYLDRLQSEYDTFNETISHHLEQSHRLSRRSVSSSPPPAGDSGVIDLASALQAVSAVHAPYTSEQTTASNPHDNDLDSLVSSASRSDQLNQLAEERKRRLLLEETVLQERARADMQAKLLQAAERRLDQLSLAHQTEQQEQRSLFEQENAALRREYTDAMVQVTLRLNQLEEATSASARRNPVFPSQPRQHQTPPCVVGGTPRSRTEYLSFGVRPKSPLSEQDHLAIRLDEITTEAIRYQTPKTEYQNHAANLSFSSAMERQENRQKSSIFRQPKIDCEPFDGDPVKWPDFVAMFRDMVHCDPNLTNVQKMAMLRHCLTKELRSYLGDCLNNPELYNDALLQLEATYGHPYLVSRSYIRTINSLPAVKSLRDYKALLTFSTTLHGSVASLRNIGYTNELQSSGLLESLLDKLPDELKSKWGKKVVKSEKTHLSLEDFDQWLHTLVRAEMIIKHPLSFSRSDRITPAQRPNVLVTTQPVSAPACPAADILTEPAPSGTSERRRCCPVCQNDHHLADCLRFNEMSLDQRAQCVREFKCCIKCLGRGHKSRECFKRRRCDKRNCNQNHHTLLHDAPKIFPDTTVTDADSIPVASVGATSSPTFGQVVVLPIVPVILQTGTKTLETFALIDGGAETTLIVANAAKALELSGPPGSYRIGTFHGEDPIVASQQVAFRMSSTDASFSCAVEQAYVVPEIKLTPIRVDWPSYKWTWPHLQDLDLPVIDPSRITVLIGRNVRGPHRVLDERTARSSGGPDAVLTPFGWCVVGPIPRYRSGRTHGPRVHSICAPASETDLRSDIARLWEDEKCNPSVRLPTRMSDEDQRAINFLESNIQHTGERWEVGLLWRDVDSRLPNNFTAALKQFRMLENRFDRDPEYARLYDLVVQGYVNDGYAKLVDLNSQAPSTGRIWYIPHHGVVSQKKPGKVRVVFNCSFVHRGTSLNQALLPGPNLLTSLVGVLLRFRQFKFAASSDIKAMYHQVAVPEQDQAALRFVYRQPGTKGALQVFQMTRHVFGAVSSPTTCIFALQHTAKEFQLDYPDASDVIKTKTYVDNVLDSDDLEMVLATRTRQVKNCVRKGGFELRQIMSTSRLLLNEFSQAELSTQLDLNFDRLPTEGTLGILLDWERDCFTYKVSSVPVKIPTMREVLRVSASIYDPLGLVSPVIITARIILQDCWRANLEWDEPLPGNLKAKWQAWHNNLTQLAFLHIPRCLRVHANPISMSFHAFCDASELGYGAGVYCRAIHLNGEVSVKLVIGKARVAPLRQQSIPRLELRAAVLGIELANLVTTELRLTDAIEWTFWTDSVTVLRWIHATNSRFHAFVAHRITEILETSSPRQWRHIPGELNPADDASRGIPASALTASHRWLNGPTFLLQDRQSWPLLANLPEPSELDPEVAPTKWIGLVQHQEPNLLFTLSARSPSWDRHIHIVGWILRFIQNSSATRPKTINTKLRYLGVHELRQSKLVAIRIDQHQFFSTEISHLAKGKPIPPTSRLNQVEPFLDEDGILRVRGRLVRGAFSQDLKHPIILHFDSPLARLIIQDAHERIQHERVQHTVNQVRSDYYILRCRQTVMKYLNKCSQCRASNTRPQVPIMAALPAVRLRSHTPPFTSVGLDYFGPIETITNRRRIKRWGVIFTCLTTRGVHLEMAYSLETDAFLNAFWRFTNRRGRPTDVYSDNGTNLTAGERELKDVLQTFDTTTIADRLARKSIVWHFNPPAAPHFGGSWERLIQSAKRALRSVLNEQTVTDDALYTALTAIENLLNGRPLTHVAVDPREPEALTPNHFILGRPNTEPIPDTQTSTTGPSLKTWRHSQAIASHFWRRWLKEYVPQLVERRKWLQHRRNLVVDDVVLIVNETARRGDWQVGRIIRVYPGSDGVVRAARVQTKMGEIERPVSKLCLLETASDEDISVGNGGGHVADADEKRLQREERHDNPKPSRKASS